MKRLEQKTTYGSSIKYITDCSQCWHFAILDGAPKCIKYHNPLNLDNGLTYTTKVNNLYNTGKLKTYIIPIWCGLPEQESYIRSAASTMNSRYDEYDDDYEPIYKKSTEKSVDNECSNCGDKSDTVDRRKNHGVCSKCLDIVKNDEMLLTKAKLKNFKLKKLFRKKLKEESKFSFYDRYNYYDY